MPRAPKIVPLGTVSSGTLRTEDLLDAFEYYCRTYGGKNGRHLAREYANLPTIHRENWTDKQLEEAEYLLEDMQACLEDIAPDYSYFGTLEGDGAEFGFWPSLETLETDVRHGEVCKVGDTAEVPAGYIGHVMQVSDHGNVTLYWKSARKFREIWSVV